MTARAIPDRDVAGLVAEMRGGLSPTAAARRYGTTRNSVLRAADRAGLDARLGRRPDPASLRRQVEDMPATQAVAFLLDLVEIAFPECRGATIADLTSAGFSVTQARIVAILRSSGGRALSYEYIGARAAVGGDAIGDRTLHVHFHKIRRRFSELGWPVQLVTHWGHGVSLSIAEGWSWPSE